MKTPFYELAEKIGNEQIPWWYISWYQNLDFDKFIYLVSLFENPLIIKDNDHRITALLFADLLWQEEMKGGGK